MKPSWIKKLSDALDLDSSFEQDWGICNSSPKRISEFILFYETNKIDHPYEPEALAELIFQSVNDHLEEASLEEQTLEMLGNFVQQHSSNFPTTFEYWLSLEGKEWPISETLRKYAS